MKFKKNIIEAWLHIYIHTSAKWVTIASAPNYYLNQCCIVINLSLRNKFTETRQKQPFSLQKLLLKLLWAKFQPLYPGVIELTHCGLVTPYGDRATYLLVNPMTFIIIRRSEDMNKKWLKTALLKLNPDLPGAIELTHWGRATHICLGKLTIIGSDNGLSPGRRQAIIWTIAGILLIGPLGTNFSEILIGIQTCSFKKMHLKMSSAKRRPFCLGLNVLSLCIDSSGLSYTELVQVLPQEMAGDSWLLVCELGPKHCYHKALGFWYYKHGMLKDILGLSATLSQACNNAVTRCIWGILLPEAGISGRYK